MAEGRQVERESMEDMIRALGQYISDGQECITKMYNDLNTCAENMGGDQFSEKTISKATKYVQAYAALTQKAEEIRKRMETRLEELVALEEEMGKEDGDDF